jgi:hypothetical protein
MCAVMRGSPLALRALPPVLAFAREQRGLDQRIWTKSSPRAGATPREVG